MIKIDIEIEIIEIKTLEGLAAEAQIPAMLLFKTQNRQIIPGTKKPAIIAKHLRMKNFEENVKRWKKKPIEWKIRYGGNANDQKIETVRNIQVITQKKATEQQPTIQEVRRAKRSAQQQERVLAICSKL